MAVFTMSIFRTLLLCTLLLTSEFADAEERPALGQPISAEEANTITIWPDGRGLPAGSGSAATGKGIYTSKCAACHGLNGKHGINAQLVGGQVAPNELPSVRTVGSYWPYATSLFDYVRRTMPYREPGSLTDEEVYAVVAYLLVLNGVMAGDEELNAQRLSTLTMPNRLRFYSDYELP